MEVSTPFSSDTRIRKSDHFLGIKSSNRNINVTVSETDDPLWQPAEPILTEEEQAALDQEKYVKMRKEQIEGNRMAAKSLMFGVE